MVRGAFLVAAVGGLGLVLGVAIAGRPQGVPNDVVVTRVPEVATTTTSIARPASTSTTSVVATSTTAVRAVSSTTTAAPVTSARRATTTTSALPAIPTAIVTTTTTAAPAATTTALPPGPSTTLVPESGLRLVVANATDAPALASRTLALLRASGYSDAVPTDAVAPRADTIIVHVEGREGEALRLASQIGIDPSQVRPRVTGRLTLGQDDADLWLLLGADRT